MNRIVLSATLAVALAFPAIAQETKGYAKDAGTVDAKLAVQDSSAQPLAAGMSEGVAGLREFGDRFQNAIRLIAAEAAKPGWRWED